MQRDNELPEGTDTVVEGVGEPTTSAHLTTDVTSTDADEDETLAIDGGAGSLTERLRTGREKLIGQAGDRARGIVSQPPRAKPLEALANVSKWSADTAGGIERRATSGAEYPIMRACRRIDRKRRNSIASKDPDE